MEEEILVNPEISIEYTTFEELVAENSGHELDYLELVSRDPLSMDTATLAFSLNRFIRMSGPLMEKLLLTLDEDDPPGLKEIFESKGLELDKNQAQRLRNIIFSFRDSGDGEAGFVARMKGAIRRFPNGAIFGEFGGDGIEARGRIDTPRHFAQGRACFG